MSVVYLVLSSVAVLFLLAPLAIVLRGRPAATVLTYGGAAIACAVVALAGLMVLSGGAEVSRAVLPVGLPWLGAHMLVDNLSAFFLIVVGLGGAATSVYAIGYGRHEHEPLRVLSFYPGFLGAMIMVVIADDAFTFLVSWEVMSLLSWALVLAHHREAEARRAGLVYLVMAAFGTMALILAFGLLAGSGGGYAFDAMRAGALTTGTGAAVVALVLVGAGSKAGLVPLHVWLPLAHPAAPSHVSALMSGVMTKVAIYGVIRVVFDLLDQAPGWMALVVMVLGGVTAVIGVLFALMQHDLKRLLAYHTVENIGIIFIGLGLAMAFREHAMTAAAALALTAALFHVLNHSLFKSLLFLGSGAILTACGERDMEKLGGLIHRMPVTSATFLVASVAISALPPFNGFVSEWLTFQAILLSPDLPDWSLRIATPGVGALLALAAALAAACFVKVYGVVFLGRPRGEAAARATEVDAWSRSVMVFLAALCLLAGILPGAVIDMISPVVSGLTGGVMPVQGNDPWATITPIATSRSSYNGLLVLIFIALSASLAAWAVHRFASRRVRRAPAWDCGFPDSNPATQYGAGSFAQPIGRVLGPALLRTREEVSMPPPGDMRPARHRLLIRDLIWDGIYAPIETVIGTVATRMNRLQFLTIRRYLALVMASLVFLLLALTLWN